jgi:hypothetical protein
MSSRGSPGYQARPLKAPAGHASTQRWHRPQKLRCIGGAARKFNIRKNGSQSNPGAKFPGDQLAVAADPTQSCLGGGGFVRKVARKVYQIGTFGSSQRTGSITPVPELSRQCPRQLVYAVIYSDILIRIGLVGAALDTKHNLRSHGKSIRQGRWKPLPGVILGGRELTKVGRTPEVNFLRLHPFRQPDRKRGARI